MQAAQTGWRMGGLGRTSNGPCLAKRHIGQLTALVKTRLKKMQYRPGLLKGFLASTSLDLAPSVNPQN